MLLIRLARMWGWAGDRCLDIADWCMRAARKDRPMISEIFAWSVIAALAALFATIVFAGLFA